MNFKKIAAVALAAMTVLGATSVFADDATLDSVAKATTGQTVTATADTVMEPTISVIVPTESKLALNPYKVEYTGDLVTSLDENVKNAMDLNAQIISVPQTITNNSNVGVSVDVTDMGVKPADGKGIKILTAAPTATSTGKEVVVYFEIKDDQVEGSAFSSGIDKQNKKQLILPDSTSTTAKLGSLSKVLTLGAAKYDESGLVANSGTTASFKIGGEMVTNPVTKNGTVTEPNAWTAADTLTVSFKFVFTPQAYVAPTTAS